MCTSLATLILFLVPDSFLLQSRSCSSTAAAVIVESLLYVRPAMPSARGHSLSVFRQAGKWRAGGRTDWKRTAFAAIVARQMFHV